MASHQRYNKTMLNEIMFFEDVLYSLNTWGCLLVGFNLPGVKIESYCLTGSYPVLESILYFRVQSSSFSERQERGNVVQEFPAVL